MSARSSNAGGDSPYVAFKNDRERKWALVSRDVRLVLIALILATAGNTLKWQPVWHFLIGE